MGITAQRLKELKLIDNIVEEPSAVPTATWKKMAIKQDRLKATAQRSIRDLRCSGRFQ